MLTLVTVSVNSHRTSAFRVGQAAFPANECFSLRTSAFQEVGRVLFAKTDERIHEDRGRSTLDGKLPYSYNRIALALSAVSARKALAPDGDVSKWS